MFHFELTLNVSSAPAINTCDYHLAKIHCCFRQIWLCSKNATFHHVQKMKRVTSPWKELRFFLKSLQTAIVGTNKQKIHLFLSSQKQNITVFCHNLRYLTDDYTFKLGIHRLSFGSIDNCTNLQKVHKVLSRNRWQLAFIFILFLSPSFLDTR